MEYMLELKASGAVHHIGLSTHSPQIARMAVEHGAVEVLLFSLNPGYDLLPSAENTGLSDENRNG